MAMNDASAYKVVIQQLERDRARLLAAAAKVETAIEALRAVQGTESANIAVPFALATNGNGQLSGSATMKDAAIFAIRHAGRPLKMREMYDTAIGAGWRYKAPYKTFRGSMAPTLKRQPEFKKTGPGLYCVVEMDD
jgi:hypothetical protein